MTVTRFALPLAALLLLSLSARAEPPANDWMRVGGCVSGALNLLQQRVRKPYSCGAQIIPGLLNWGDTPEIASLIAPRHCLWEVGSRDDLIPPKEADEALRRLRRAYQALGAEDRLQVDRFEGGHVLHGKAAYSLLEKVLG
jgi:hypothetical protein